MYGCMYGCMDGMDGLGAHLEGNAGAASLGGGGHVCHDALAVRKLGNDGARVLVVDLDDDLLDGLETGSVGVLLVEHAGRAHTDLEPLAAHVLEEDACKQGDTLVSPWRCQKLTGHLQS